MKSITYKNDYDANTSIRKSGNTNFVYPGIKQGQYHKVLVQSQGFYLLPDFTNRPPMIMFNLEHLFTAFIKKIMTPFDKGC